MKVMNAWNNQSFCLHQRRPCSERHFVWIIKSNKSSVNRHLSTEWLSVDNFVVIEILFEICFAVTNWPVTSSSSSELFDLFRPHAMIDEAKVQAKPRLVYICIKRIEVRNYSVISRNYSNFCHMKQLLLIGK